ncbi:MAG: hypothetical protein ABSB52_01115 [Acidimicrobiales bacterium]
MVGSPPSVGRGHQPEERRDAVTNGCAHDQMNIARAAIGPERMPTMAS